ncbi:MAG: leucine-rich repeat domain-containing protein [Saprospiraceae bacterium]|nr:leucine-rich repeat domain-containing protein [Saprospiraceae bacterium]
MDLEKLWIIDVPKEIEELLWLEVLTLRNNKISNLVPISKLINLKELNCSYSKVSDLSPISNLVNLNVLECHNSLVEDLSPITPLLNLYKLNLVGTLVIDLRPILPLIKKIEQIRGAKIRIGKWGYPGISIDDKIIYPPIGILTKGHDAILQYFEEPEKPNQRGISSAYPKPNASSSGKAALAKPPLPKNS